MGNQSTVGQDMPQSSVLPEHQPVALMANTPSRPNRTFFRTLREITIQ